MADHIETHVASLVTALQGMPETERIENLNHIRAALHAISPFAEEPVDCVLWLPAEQVEANDYNPNTVAPPEMRLLETSIRADGYTQPVVVWPKEEGVEVVDGFHRTRIGKESPDIYDRLHGRLPVTVIRHDREGRGDRIAATIRHNRARGRHQVGPMAGVVQELTRRNWSDKRIGRELGMEEDEVLRLKQVTGLAELFTNEEFSQAWEAE